MEQPETMKCIFHEEISANNCLRPQARLVHEHLFINSDAALLVVNITAKVVADYWKSNQNHNSSCRKNALVSY